VFVVELSDANVQEHAVVVEFVDAALAFIAVAHADPFVHLARLLLADALGGGGLGRVAMARVAGGVVAQNQPVEHHRQKQFEVREVDGDEGRGEEQVRHPDDAPRQQVHQL
jgi:hypothetical protein